MNTDSKISELSRDEIESISGGLTHAAAYAIAVGLGALVVAAYAAGYQLGKDLAE